jgi:D-alanyl-D-alanine dipeptidase
MLTKLLVAGLVMAANPARLTCQDRPDPATAVNTAALPLAGKAAADSLLVDVHDLDSTIQLDVRYATADNFTGAPLPGYEVARVLLRREAARALVRVQARLRPQGLGLVIFDGYRPVRASNAMVKWAQRSGHKDLIADGYIASRSRHNLGVAVDLTLIDRIGRRPEMGTPYDTFSEAAHTANATGQAQRFRQILVRAMEAEGFINYEKEWWHFSYPVTSAMPFDEPIRASSPGGKGLTP